MLPSHPSSPVLPYPSHMIQRTSHASHMPLHVQCQVIRPGEGTVTHVALEGSDASVFAVMACEFIRPCKLPAAAFPVTVVRFLTWERKSSMNFLDGEKLQTKHLSPPTTSHSQDLGPSPLASLGSHHLEITQHGSTELSNYRIAFLSRGNLPHPCTDKLQ